MAPKMAPKGIQKDTQNVGVKIGVDFPAGPPKCRRENRCGNLDGFFYSRMWKFGWIFLL